MQGPELAKLAPLRSRALVDDVYDLLLGLLTEGKLSADAPLGIDALSRQLGISPTPIREALAKLEHTGLVRREANRGYRVSPPLSVRQMRELIDARLVFESGALERAMKESTELATHLRVAFQDHEAAAKALEAPEALHDRDKVQTYYQRDWNFHQVILNHAHNMYIDRAVNALSFSFHRMRQTSALGMTDAPIAISEHKMILKAIESGNLKKSLQALAAHLDNVTIRATSAAEDGASAE